WPMAIWACAATDAPAINNASEAVLKSDFIVIAVFLLLLLISIVVRPVPTSMRKRVEFPVGLDLPPAMRKPVGLEHQKRDDDQPDRRLAQERYVGDEGEHRVDRTSY